MATSASGRCFSLPWHSVKGLNIGDGVYVFVLAQLAAPYEFLRCVCLAAFEFILQAHNLWGNSERLSAPKTRHSTVALHQFSDHLNLTESHKVLGLVVGLNSFDASLDMRELQLLFLQQTQDSDCVHNRFPLVAVVGVRCHF